MKVISVIGYKNTGKTTLVTKLVKALSGYGSVGTVKLMLDHRFNPSKTDTGKHFDAGADMVAAVTSCETVSIKRGPGLAGALEGLADEGMDFCLVEGARQTDLPKILLGELEGTEEINNIIIQLPARQDQDIDALVGTIRKLPEYVTLSTLIKEVRNHPDINKTGGIATFTGIVRHESGEIKTQKLEFERYDTVAAQAIAKICQELKEREGIIEVLIHHKAGILAPGEDIVYIVVAAAHRQELFLTLSEALEKVKSEVPIWKKEITVDGNFWVHDHA